MSTLVAPPFQPPQAQAPPPPAPDWPIPNTHVDSRRRDRVATSIRVALGLIGIGIAFVIDSNIFGPVAALFVIVAPFEKLYPRKKGQKVRRPLAAMDITFALMGPVLNVVAVVVGVAIAAVSLFWLPGLAFRPLVSMMPLWMVAIVAFVVFDFLGYWTHRWAHEVPFLWRFHAVHHSPEHMDWISGFRIHPLDGIIIAPAVAFLLAAGVDAEVTGLLALLQISLGLFFHANVRLRLRPLDRLFANPEFHHWHHANESDSIGHNYAPALPLWDLIFGTFFMPRGDRRPAHYGVDEPTPRTMIGLLLYPLRGARPKVAQLRHPVRTTKALARFVRRLLSEVWATSTRKTHSVRRESSRGCTSTNATLFDPADAPGRPAPEPVVIRF